MSFEIMEEKQDRKNGSENFSFIDYVKKSFNQITTSVKGLDKRMDGMQKEISNLKHSFEAETKRNEKQDTQIKEIIKKVDSQTDMTKNFESKIENGFSRKIVSDVLDFQRKEEEYKENERKHQRDMQSMEMELKKERETAKRQNISVIIRWVFSGTVLGAIVTYILSLMQG